MACKYYNTAKGIEYNAIKDVIEAFYAANMPLDNSAIFSAEQIQQSTVDAILAIKDINAYDKTATETVTDYITSPKKDMFANVLGQTDKERFAPEYILENRIYQYVIDRIDKLKIVDASELQVKPENLEKLLENNTLKSYSIDKVKYLLNEIETIIAHEEKVRDFGTLLHQLVSLNISDRKGEYNTAFDNFYKKPENQIIFGEYSKAEWKRRVDSIVAEIRTKVLKHGTPITEIFILSDPNAIAKVKGKIDLIAVDSDGVAHIFEIKISKTEYSNWDSAKKLTLDWQLGFYRQLLGQHVDIEQTMLYTIPVFMPELGGDPDSVILQDFVNRKSEKGSGLNTGGALTRALDKLIPRKILTTYDPKRQEQMMNNLHKLMGDEYQVKTDLEDSSLEAVMNSARERFKKEGVWRKYNNFDDIEDLPRGYVDAATEEEFKAKMEIYTSHVLKQMNRNVSILKDAMVSAIKTSQNIKTSAHSAERDIIVNHILKEYVNEEWMVVTGIPETIPLGLIVLKNRRTGIINIISLTVNQLDAMSHIPGKNYGDLEFYKSMLFIDQFKKQLLPTEASRIGEIIIFNPRDMKNPYYYRNTLTKFKEFRDLAVTTEVPISINENNFAGIEDIAMYNLDVNFRNYNEKDKEKINEVFNLFMNSNLDALDIDKLIEIQAAFFEKFPEYKKKTIKPELNFNDKKEMLLALLQVAIISKSGYELNADFKNLSTYSLNFSDFKSLFAALYSHEQAEYDKAGRRIQGLVGGLAWSPPDWIRSKDLRNINTIMSTANSHIGKRMMEESEDLFKATDTYYTGIGFSEAARNIVGETQSRHVDLWETKDGKATHEYRTKNPYDPSNGLTKVQSDYLKEMLLHINMWKWDIPKDLAMKLDVNNIESLKTNEKLKKALESGEYFEMPLVRREEVTRYKGALDTPGKLWKDKIKPYMHEINDFLDPRELLKEDLETIQLQKMGFYEMYDVYGAQTKEYKANVLEKNGVDYFELNLDTIAHRIAFNKIRKQTLDRKLPIINSYLWWIKLLGGKQNVDISKQLEYVADQMNLAIYDEPIIDDEFKDLATVTAVAKRITTAAMLAFRPVLFFKEMTIGVMKGAALAATQIYGEDQFTLKDLTLAYKKLATIDNKFANEFNLIDRLNQYYRFANMDINTIAKKMQTDRRGVARGLGRWMYAANTIPDYYNRLSLFLAKMIHDGSYEAHSLVDGKFTYDPRKDQRFAYYLENRDKHKDSNGYFIAAKGDEKYNKQRQHYLIIMQQLNNEYKGEGVSELKEADLIHSAYSEKERSSFKSFTDMAYGYYDKDSQAQINNGFFGMAYLQFMQFWPGKMKMWFAKPVSAEDSPMGKFEQVFTLNPDGTKKLWWRKPVIGADGEYVYENGQVKVDIVEENTGDPALKWTGTAYEGLAYSIAYTLQDIAKLDFKAAFSNTDGRRNRLMFALADAILIFIIMGIAAAFLQALLDDSEDDSDVRKELLQFATSATTKIHNETNIYNNTLGAIKSEPAFLAWGQRVGGDMMEVLQGDTAIRELLAQNVGATEFLK